MGQPIQPHLVGILVLCLRLHLQGLHTGVALLGGDVLGILLPKNALRELPGLPFVSDTIFLRFEDGVLACRRVFSGF